MASNKPVVKSKFMPILMAAQSYMSQSSLFGRGSYGTTGGDNLADSKHKKLWQDFGYPETIEFYMHWNMWRRNGLAKRGAKLPVTICWYTHPCVEENTESEKETAYEKEFNKLCDRLNIWPIFKEGDLCQRIGRYSALLLTVDDGKDRGQPLETVNIDKLVRIQPLFEDQLIPADINQNKNSPRFNLPNTYTLQTGNTGNRNDRAVDGGQIHWTRVIILAEDSFGDDIYGIACNESGFNALLNWQKVQGSGGEGFWRQAAQRFVLQATGGTEPQDFSSEELTELGEMVADMFAGFDAIPAVGNYELKGLNSGSMPNPDGYRQMCLEEYAASIEAPAKMLVGTQTGIKAADEDTGFYFKEMQSRRENTITPWIRAFIDWLTAHTNVKEPSQGVSVVWDDLTAPSASEKLSNSKDMSVINKDNVSSGGKRVFTENEIREAAGYEEIEALGDFDDDFLTDEDLETDPNVPADE